MYQEAADDLTILPTAELWRRIFPDNDFIHTEPNGDIRASSLAFTDNGSDPMSMFLAAEAKDLTTVLEGHPGFGVASLTAEVLRSNRQIIVRDPHAIPGHVLVIGPKSSSTRKRLAKAATILWPPTIPTTPTTGPADEPRGR